MNKILLLLCLVSLMACNDEQHPRETDPAETAGLSDTLVLATNRSVTLLPEAEEKVSDWLTFATAYNQVEDLKTATGRQLIAGSQPLVQIMENLANTLPDSLQQTAVMARTNVLKTKAHLLHQVSTKKEIKAEEVFSAANNVILEFDNFKIQLNELFLKTPEDFEIELDRQFEQNQDSVQQARERSTIPLQVREVQN